ncbi:MAG: hypothetical protein RLZZ226_537 [Pseudomonadota bacterium]|jgi:hypothetical protein
MTLQGLAFDITQSVLIVVMGILLIRLRGQCKTLEQRHQSLQDMLNKYRREQYGLGSAAVQVDKRLMDQEKRLREIIEKIECGSAGDSAGSPYYTAIDRIKKGASAQQVVADYGLSLSEATLLHNLYADTRHTSGSDKKPT